MLKVMNWTKSNCNVLFLILHKQANIIKHRSRILGSTYMETKTKTSNNFPYSYRNSTTLTYPTTPITNLQPTHMIKVTF